MFEYSAVESTILPSKITATELKGKILDTEISDGTVTKKDKLHKLKKPDFTRKNKPLTGSDKGTALHYVMQYIDYSKCGSVESLSGELERLVERPCVCITALRVVVRVVIEELDAIHIGLYIFRSPFKSIGMEPVHHTCYLAGCCLLCTDGVVI